MKKILIEFREREYKEAQKMYNNKLQALEELTATVKTLMPDKDIDAERVKENALQYYYDFLEAGNNPMNLKGEKIVSLMDIDTSKLMLSQKKFKAFSHISEPVEDNFKIYAETKEEHERLQLANDILELLDRCKDHCGFIKRSQFSPVLLHDAGDDFKPNPRFVKNGRVRHF